MVGGVCTPVRGALETQGRGRGQGRQRLGTCEEGSCLAWGGDFGVALPTSAQGLGCFWAPSRRGRGAESEPVFPRVGGRDGRSRIPERGGRGCHTVFLAPPRTQIFPLPGNPWTAFLSGAVG